MSELLDQIAARFSEYGASGAFDELRASLLARRNYGALFEARLLAKRHELGLPLGRPALTPDVPAELRKQYEAAFAEAALEAGRLYLENGDIESAWPYFRAAGEPGPVHDAIQKLDAGAASDRIIEIAFHERVNAFRGFELLLATYGTCRAISFFEQYPDEPSQEQARQLLVRTIHSEVVANLKRTIEANEGRAPEQERIPELIASREWLFGDFDYYVDTSHLISVLRFSLDLRDREALLLAIELAKYGAHLSSNFRFETPPPFEDTYRDHGLYLKALAGTDVDEAVALFRSKADAHADEPGNPAAQILITLLGRLGRHREAVEVHENYLKGIPDAELACPSLVQLCELAGDFEALLRDARDRDDAIRYVAALLGSQATSR